MSYAEKKEDRQMRLKVLFANVEKLAEEMRSELMVKDDKTGDNKRDSSDQRISRRGVLRGPRDESNMEMIPGSFAPRTPTRSLPLVNQVSDFFF